MILVKVHLGGLQGKWPGSKSWALSPRPKGARKDHLGAAAALATAEDPNRMASSALLHRNHELFPQALVPLFLGGCSLKRAKPQTRVPFFPRVTEQLSGGVPGRGDLSLLASLISPVGFEGTK